MKGFYPHSGALKSQGCMAKTKIWQKLRWRLQPKVIKVEVWSHPGAISPSSPLTMESDFSSLGVQRRKVSGRGRKRLNENNWSRVTWSSAGGQVSWGNFLQPVTLGLPDPEQCEGTAQCLPPSTALQRPLPAQSCSSWQKTFCSGWFLWLAACKHCGCSCSQWC